MKDGTQRGIREVRRNDRERKKARERRTLPPLLPPPLFHSFLRQQNVAKVGLKRQKWGDAMVRRKGGRQGLIGHVRQYILPSRSTHPPSLLFSCLAPSLTTLICFPLCVIRTRWIWLFSLASLLPDPPHQPPFSSLFPPGFARLWHPTDFVTLWFLARRWKYQAESPFHQAKDEGLKERKHEEEALENQMAPSLSLLSLLFIFHILFVCLAGIFTFAGLWLCIWIRVVNIMQPFVVCSFYFNTRIGDTNFCLCKQIYIIRCCSTNNKMKCFFFLFPLIPVLQFHLATVRKVFVVYINSLTFCWISRLLFL